MIIVHKISDLLFDLFPKAKAFGNDTGILKEELQAYYSFGPYQPQVSMSDSTVEILIDVPSIINEKPEFDKAIALCEKQKYGEAKKILENLIKQNPSVSEYHRVFGQILSDEGNQEEAINCMIDALKWNPKNRHALIMMGNIFARHKNDVDTASKYYNEAIAHSPDDFIAINNLGTNLIMLNKWEEGLKYLEAAYEINPDYPQTNYGIGLVNEHFRNTLIAFEYAISCLKKCGKNDSKLFNQALALAIKTSEQYIKTDIGKKVFIEYKSFLEKKSGKEIKVEIDSEIPTSAKIEFAENYNREFHLIRYKEKYLAVEHLMMHELVHLDFAIDAKNENSNMLFISGSDKRNLFLKNNLIYIEKLKKDGYDEKSIANYMNALFEGMNRQIYNTPIDLFIEDFLFENYQELRPYQFISLYGIVTEGMKAVTDDRGQKVTPKEILSASKILNIVHALHFKDLFGFDLISQFKAIPGELREANRLYDEYKEYRKDRKPGEEYELVGHWSEDLKIDKYFELVDEKEFREKRINIESLLSSIEQDPLGMDSNLKRKEEQMDDFQKNQEKMGINPAVMWFMVDALKYFKNIPFDKIKETAREIAYLGTQGIVPGAKTKYKLQNVPGKDFSGYHLLAYYYVSWKLAIPEMVGELNLPYDKEYEMARKMAES